MGNPLLAYPDRTMETTTTLTGGSWSATLPLANLQNRLMKKVAESTNALAASTQFVETLATPRDVRVIGILGHNLTLAAMIRVRGYSDAGLTALVYDTGTQYAWPQIFSSDDVTVWPNNWIWPVTPLATARYWLIELVDTGNPAGKVRLGRFWLGPAFEPATGMAFGNALGYESGDVIVTSLGGVDWGSRRDQRRVISLTFPVITQPEKRTALIMQKTLGKTGELLWVSDSAAAAEDMLLESFPARVCNPSPLRNPYVNNNVMLLELIENV